MATASTDPDEARRRQQIVDEFHRLGRARLVAQIERWPTVSYTGVSSSKSARGADTITASVPCSAPLTPPLTGLSIATISAWCEQVVDLDRGCLPMSEVVESPNREP